MSLRQKWLRVLSQLMPAGAVGAFLLLGVAAPGGAAQLPANAQRAAVDPSPVAEGLAAIRQAVLDIAGNAVGLHPGEQQLAWGNRWRNARLGQLAQWLAQWRLAQLVAQFVSTARV